MNDDTAILRSTVQRLLSESVSIETLGRIVDDGDGYDEALWQRLVSELGLGGLLVPGDLGGVGGSWDDVGVVLTELGRVLAPVPYLGSSVIAVTVLRYGQDQSMAQEILESSSAGRVVVAVSDPMAPTTKDRVAAVETGPERWALRGRSGPISWAGRADWVLLRADIGQTVGWFIAAVSGSDVAVGPVAALDGTRPAAAIEFVDAPAYCLALGENAAAISERVIDVAAAGLACELLGAAERLLELSVEHARSRVQFGQPIGSFQAVQHKLADMAIRVDEMRSGAHHAVASLRDGSTENERRAGASLAAVVAKEAAWTVASEAIQVHGGIGFTWEHPCHRYFRRAAASASAFGSAAFHRERLLKALGV